MAVFTAIDDPELYFQVKTYTGTGSSQAITLDGSEDMAPDLVWIKNRESARAPVLFDSVRGAEKRLVVSGADTSSTDSNMLTAFGSDGFTVGSSNEVNESSDGMVAWNWKAGTTSGLTGGTLTPTAYSINTTSGFSAIAYTGNASAGATVPHGLGVVPEMMIVKSLNGATDWNMYHQDTHSTPEDYILVLNTSAIRADNNTSWNDTAPTSTVFTVGGGGDTNVNTNTYIAYCFASKQGYSKFGSYTGNGNTDGPFVYTGFRPAFVIFKKSDGAADWEQVDDQRLGYNPDQNYFNCNEAFAEQTGDIIDLVSNGFKIRGDDSSGWNKDGGEYIYIAFAKAPFVNSNGVPCNAR